MGNFFRVGVGWLAQSLCLNAVDLPGPAAHKAMRATPPKNRRGAFGLQIYCLIIFSVLLLPLRPTTLIK